VRSEGDGIYEESGYANGIFIELKSEIILSVAWPTSRHYTTSDAK
jgi:hypothetical protein